MIRKVLVGVMTLLLAFCMSGCGDDSEKSAGEKSAEVVKPEGRADKAVLAYAQLYAYGMVEDENMMAAGMTESSVNDVQEQVIAPLVQAFQGYPLSDDNVEEITSQYVAKLHVAMNMKTKIKTDDPKNPVVELTATTINKEEAVNVAENDEDLFALGVALGKLQSEGFTEEQLKDDPEFQETAMDAVEKFIDKLPLNPEQTIEVTCKAVEGSDGKIYWAPENPEEVAKFVGGQN